MNSNIKFKNFLLPVYVVIFSFILINVEITAGRPTKPTAEKSDSSKINELKDESTEGAVSINGREIKYNAIAGNIILKNGNDEQTARIFYVVYFNTAVKDKSMQPVTFLYNGGPGSSTIWLHMGAFGPKRVETVDNKYPSAAPYKLINNEYSLLDVSDLVFIDAPGTGFSRIIGKGRDEDFYGVDKDAFAFAQFISQFISKYGRWNSPKYLFGESYGTTRSAVLANILETRNSIRLNGVILLSAILNYDTFTDYPQLNPGIDLPYVLSLPSAAAAAWYHQKLPEKHSDLNLFLKEVENFTTNEYTLALQKGSLLSSEEKHSIAEKLHDYTGLPVSYIEKSDLRINGGQYEKELQSDSDLTTGRLDTRFSGFSMDPLSKEPEYDPLDAAIFAVYVSLFNDYVRKDLKFGEDMSYIPIESLWGSWNFLHRPPGSEMAIPIATNVLPDLAAVMKFNPNLKVMLNSGYFDLATPFYASEFCMHHLQIPKELEKNIEYYYYKSGHMVYISPESLKELHDNVAKFIKETNNIK